MGRKASYYQDHSECLPNHEDHYGVNGHSIDNEVSKLGYVCNEEMPHHVDQKEGTAG